jgi:hypothetical protein
MPPPGTLRSAEMCILRNIVSDTNVKRLTDYILRNNALELHEY